MALPRAGILHPDLRGGAGSETVAVWLAQALRGMAQVTLISMGPIDLPRLDGLCGTDLAGSGIETISLPFPPGPTDRFDALRAFRLGRWAKAHASEFDVLVSAYNVMDFGRRGIQIIADISFDDRLRRRLHPAAAGMKGFFYAGSPLRSIYLWLGRALARQSRHGWRRNLTYANSAWTRDVFERRFDLPCGLLYPPVAAGASAVPWEERENGFVVMARLAPEKGIERTIAILDEVRHIGQDVHLHILGRADDPSTIGTVRRLCRERAGWASYEGFVGGEAKSEFLARHRYGLSGCRYEAFGMAVAEMSRAGMIVWVPRAGGQVEIVGDGDLAYDDERDAARTIAGVLDDTARQADLRRRLEACAAEFSTDRFVSEVRAIVGDFLARGGDR
jgi:glycosyltransferase involved in cell wall biosynthesis